MPEAAPEPCSHGKAGCPHGPPAGGALYRPRDPSTSVLVQVLRRHLDAFEERCRQDGDEHAPPDFVFDALRAVSDCGDLSRGFVRLACDRCRAPRVVPFSCKSPVCPSCGGRRMAELAARGVDRLLPHVPYRQWVVSLPFELRLAVAFDTDLMNAVFAYATRAILGLVERLGAEHGVAGQPVGVLHLQRFQDGAAVNPHAHYVISDAVFAGEGPPHPDPDARARAVTVTTRPPTREELQGVVDTLERDVLRMLARRQRRASSPEAQRIAAILARFARTPPAAETRIPGVGVGQAPRKASAPLCARSAKGFDLHAGVALPANARDRLERLLRYLARPPLPLSRLSVRGNGNVVIHLKRAWSRGTVAVEYTPLAFIAKLAALVPPPRFVAARTLGGIAPHAALRPRVLPVPPPSTSERPVTPPRPERLTWAELMVRVLSIDPLVCPCGGRFRVISAIERPDVIEAIAAALIASGHLAPHRAPRGPPANALRRGPRSPTAQRPKRPRSTAPAA